MLLQLLSFQSAIARQFFLLGKFTVIVGIEELFASE
jgi:hypothetical protein